MERLLRFIWPVCPGGTKKGNPPGFSGKPYQAEEEKFVLRGKQEAEIIKRTGNITGRTALTKGTAVINPVQNISI